MNDIEDISDRLTAKAEEVRVAATALSDRIVKFEEYLQKLSGRVEATYTEGGITLTLRREGSKWRLGMMRADLTIIPLVDAGLPKKLEAIRIFPGLLVAIHTAQDTLIQDLQRASKTFDDFFQSLPPAKARMRVPCPSIGSPSSNTTGSPTPQKEKTSSGVG
jgi:hypothetical protein